MKRIILLGVLISAGALSMTVAAMQQPAAGGQQAPRVVEIQKLKDNLFMMTGGGGNSSVFVTATGVTVVDTKNPGWGQPLLDAIRKVTDKPVTMIINTHTHGDHVSGNVEFPAEVDIVTHANTAANMKEMRPNSSAAPNPNPPNIFRDNNGKGLAKRTFTDRMTIGRGAEQIDLYYFGRAHTNGDAMVYFPAHRIFHIADVFPGKELPIMDSNNGGTGVGYADTLSKALSFTSKSADTLVSGHSATTTTNADLKDYIGFIQGYVKDVQAAKAAGKTVEDFAMGWKPPTGYTAQPARVVSNARTIYNETK
jgi:cyclase